MNMTYNSSPSSNDGQIVPSVSVVTGGTSTLSAAVSGSWRIPWRPRKVGRTDNGAQTNYTYGYTTNAWTVTATTNNAVGGTSHYTTATMDGFGRTVEAQSGNGSTVVSTVDTVYAPYACSPMGKMSQQSEPYTTGAEVYTTYSYDALGRPVKVLLADGASYTSYIYQNLIFDLQRPDTH